MTTKNKNGPRRSRSFPAKWPGTCKKCNQSWKKKDPLVYENDVVVHETCPTANSKKSFRQFLENNSGGNGSSVRSEEDDVPDILSSPSKAFNPSAYQQAIGDWAVDGEGNAVVEAVAGSGKTTTIVWLLSQLDPSLRILFLAFNKHIVRELRRRVPEHITVRTVHSLGLSIIRKMEDFQDVDNDKLSYYMNEFWSISRDEVKDPAVRAENRNKRTALRKVVGLVKATLIDYNNPDAVLNLINRYNIQVEEQHEQEIIERLPGVMEQSNANLEIVDYDDMPYLPLVNNRLKLHFDKYDFILVDEAQDLNASNIQLILGCVAEGGRVIAVGDRYQSLYGFRGADTEAIPRLIEMLGAQTLPLSISYRCPRTHVEYVKKLVPHIEAAENAKEGILGTIEYAKLVQGVEEGDMVLCRTNAPLVKPAFDTIKKGTKAIIRGKNIGDELINFVERFQADTLSRLEILMAEYFEHEFARLMDKNKDMQAENLKDRYETVLEISRQCKTVPEVLTKLGTLFSDDNIGVVYSSVHRAKGLEAERVFLLHPELLPHPRAKQDWERIQEDNAIYVARTRSLNEFYVVLGEEE
jgi:DNA helicase-2/ATP-dependent DNA helicase PcrA